MWYEYIKWLHIGCVAISITGFTARGWLKLSGSPYARQLWIRITPHIVDTVLLVSAVYLVMASQQYPSQQGWLQAKLVGLLLYIGFGSVVIRFGRNNTERAIAFVMALCTFAYIVAVALTRQPLPL